MCSLVVRFVGRAELSAQCIPIQNTFPRGIFVDVCDVGFLRVDERRKEPWALLRRTVSDCVLVLFLGCTACPEGGVCPGGNRLWAA